MLDMPRFIPNFEEHEVMARAPDPPESQHVPRLVPTADQLRSTITVVGRVYFQNPAMQPVGFEDAYSYHLDGKDEPYSYRTKLTAEWVPLDFGWLEGKRVSLVRVDNDEGKWGQTSELELAKRTIEIGVLTEDDDTRVYHLADVPYKQAGQLRFIHANELRLRCEAGAICTVTLFPR
jgi:hypothetical protein